MLTSTSASLLGQIAWRGFRLLYGVTSLVSLVGIAALRDGAFTKRVSEEEKKQLVIAQEKYWSLTTPPIPGFSHAFVTLKNGVKLHYVVRQPSEGEPGRTKNVGIFIHGFPDSFLLWKNILTSSDLDSHILIAVDMPGYGGSDSLSDYGAEAVLETMTGFILAMRQEYLQEGSKLIVVAHDWGGIICSRLAAEAQELADRFIIASAIIPAQLQSNASSLLASSRRMLHTFVTSPFRNTRLLRTAYITSRPVISQIHRSFYIFVFNLPHPLARYFCRMANFWFLRAMHKLQAGVEHDIDPGHLSDKETADYMAMSAGPAPAQMNDDKRETDGQGYGASVKRRAQDFGMAEKIRIYREGLAFGPWEKSLETVIALSEIPVDVSRCTSGTALFEDGPSGALKAPATVIIGEKDPTFEAKLSFNGLGDYLAKNSQVLQLQSCGHWLPFERVGWKAIAEVAAWALEGEEGPLPPRFLAVQCVKFLTEK